MVYRIHFTAEDLARTRVAESPSPLLEVVLAAWRLQDRNPSTWLVEWRRKSIAQLPRQARMLLDLTPVGGYTPCFLSPTQPSTRPASVADQLEQVRSTPRAHIRQQMARFAMQRPVPAWARRLDDDPQVLQHLAEAVGQVFATLAAPYWPQVSAQVTADRAVRARDLLDGGVHRLLSGLDPPRIRWTPPVLQVATASGIDTDLHLNGRGLLIIPSIFGTEAPTIGHDDIDDLPCLTYPVGSRDRLLNQDAVTQTGGTASMPIPISLLLGRTRAETLGIIAQRPGCTTGELAAALGISLSSASEHATVLRAAGLITTTRHRKMALHTPTRTGLALLNGSAAASANGSANGSAGQPLSWENFQHLGL